MDQVVQSLEEKSRRKKGGREKESIRKSFCVVVNLNMVLRKEKNILTEIGLRENEEKQKKKNHKKKKKN